MMCCQKLKFYNTHREIPFGSRCSVTKLSLPLSVLGEVVCVDPTVRDDGSVARGSRTFNFFKPCSECFGCVGVFYLLFVVFPFPRIAPVACSCSGPFRLDPQEHFTQMRVVGQFNLGFMICLLGSDLFILDQHACDEKYNFEVLQETTTIHQQPLVR